MTKKHLILSIMLIFAVVFSMGNASAYTVFPEKETKTLKKWEFSSDYFKSGSPQESSWGDRYGNKNVWNVKYSYKSDDGETVTEKAFYTAALGIPQMYCGSLNNNRGDKGYFYFYDAGNVDLEDPSFSSRSYGDVPGDGDFYLTWTSPIDGVVKVNMTGKSVWVKTYPIYFSIMVNGKEVPQLSYSAIGERVGRTVTQLVRVAKGDTISARVNFADGPNGFLMEMKVSEVRSAIMSTDYNKTWNARSDYISLGKPASSVWGDNYGNNDIWGISYYNPETGEEKQTVFKTKPAASNWYHPDEDIYIYDDGNVFYGETKGKKQQMRINWTAPYDTTVIARLTGMCVWGNTPTGVKFTIMKNGVAVASDAAAGAKNQKTFEQKITLVKGDKISFTAEIAASGAEGYRITAEIEERHGIQVTEDPTFVFTDADGNAAAEPSIGGKIGVSLPIYNASTEKIRATVFMALYGEDNSLIGLMKTDCGEIAGDETYISTGEIETEKLPSKISVFAWDSEVGMQPYYSGYTKSF